MSQLVKKIVKWFRGGDVRNDSVQPLENDGASACHRSQPNTSNCTQIPTSRKRKSKLTSTVTLEQMKKDGVFKFSNAGSLSAAEIWGDSQIDTDANLAPCAINEKRPRFPNICRQNSGTEKKEELDDWDNIPSLSIDEIMGDMVIPAKELDHMLPTYDMDIALAPSFTNKENESYWSIWRRNSQLTDNGLLSERQLDDTFGNCDDAGCQSIEDIMKDIVVPENKLDHTVCTHDSQMDTDVTPTSCNATDKDENLSIIWSQTTPLSHPGTSLKKRRLNDLFDDIDDLSRASSESILASTTEHLDTTPGQADHTISTPKAQVDTSAVPLVITAAEQSQTSPRIPKRKRRRAARRWGKKRNYRPRNQ